MITRVGAHNDEPQRLNAKAFWQPFCARLQAHWRLDSPGGGGLAGGWCALVLDTSSMSRLLCVLVSTSNIDIVQLLHHMHKMQRLDHMHKMLEDRTAALLLTQTVP